MEYGRKSSLPRCSQTRSDWWTAWKYSLRVEYRTDTPNSSLLSLMYFRSGSMLPNWTDEL